MTSLGEIQFYVYGINMIFGKNFKKILIAFLVFLFAFQAVSIIFSLYWRLPWIDNFTHFLGGATAGMGMIWWTFYSAKISPMTKSLPKIYIFVIILGFVALVGVFWEIYELIVDRLITKNNYISILQSSGLIDTMKDLVVDLLGGSAVIWLFFNEIKKQ